MPLLRQTPYHWASEVSAAGGAGEGFCFLSLSDEPVGI